MTGRVYLVGAGPGDPELLTIKALRILRNADVVLHDDLVGPGIVELVSSTAFVRNVGKRCGKKSLSQEALNAMMIAHASAGLLVVRLKGGDPTLFGRAAEEIAGLRSAGVPVEVVPGVSAALGAAAAAGFSLTDRRVASSVVFVTPHRLKDRAAIDWRGVVSSEATVVVYMPGSDYGWLAQQLISAGFDRETPCLLMSNVSLPSQNAVRTVLKDLHNVSQLPAPTVAVVGRVCHLASEAEVYNHLRQGEGWSFEEFRSSV